MISEIRIKNVCRVNSYIVPFLIEEDKHRDYISSL